MDFALDTSLLHLLHRASQIADDYFVGHSELDGLTSRQLVVLAAIRAREGASQTDITELTGVDRSTLTDLIGRLQSRGLVLRNRAKHDARSYEVHLTTAGRDALESAAPIALAAEELLTRALSVADRKAFTQLLRAIVASGPSPLPGRGAGIR